MKWKLYNSDVWPVFWEEMKIILQLKSGENLTDQKSVGEISAQRNRLCHDKHSHESSSLHVNSTYLLQQHCWQTLTDDFRQTELRVQPLTDDSRHSQRLNIYHTFTSNLHPYKQMSLSSGSVCLFQRAVATVTKQLKHRGPASRDLNFTNTPWKKLKWHLLQTSLIRCEKRLIYKYITCYKHDYAFST